MVGDGRGRTGSALSRRDLGAALLGAGTGLAAAGATWGEKAAPLSRPGGRPILTVTGRIARTDGTGAARFDLSMLEALGTDGFVTTTPRDDAPARYEGVRMDRLMREVGATGDTVVAYALSDDGADLPAEDFGRYGVLLALRRDGQYIAVRDGGPLMIVYPYDSYPELRQPRFYGRSLWQVARLDVR